MVRLFAFCIIATRLVELSAHPAFDVEKTTQCLVEHCAGALMGCTEELCAERLTAAHGCTAGCAPGDSTCAVKCHVHAEAKEPEVASCVSAKCGESLVGKAEERFAAFEARFARVYETTEERTQKLGTFVANLGRAFLQQISNPSAEYDVDSSPLGDWTQAEFDARNNLRKSKEVLASSEVAPAPELPKAFDWREKGAVTEVKNQGDCGSCWSFSTVGNVEGVNFLKTGKLLSLSEQELVDCDKDPDNYESDDGCEGGILGVGMVHMWKKHLGLETEEDYPYKAKDGNCSLVSSKQRVFISNSTQLLGPTVGPLDEDLMAAALMKHGPLAVAMNAMSMQFYKGGIAWPFFFHAPFYCMTTDINHGVVVVGFGEEKTMVGATKYWIIKNSWSEKWGEQGYYRIVRGHGACGVNAEVYTSFPSDSVDEETIVV